MDVEVQLALTCSDTGNLNANMWSLTRTTVLQYTGNPKIDLAIHYGEYFRVPIPVLHRLLDAMTLDELVHSLTYKSEYDSRIVDYIVHKYNNNEFSLDDIFTVLDLASRTMHSEGVFEHILFEIADDDNKSIICDVLLEKYPRMSVTLMFVAREGNDEQIKKIDKSKLLFYSNEIEGRLPRVLSVTTKSGSKPWDLYKETVVKLSNTFHLEKYRDDIREVLNTIECICNLDVARLRREDPGVYLVYLDILYPVDV